MSALGVAALAVALWSTPSAVPGLEVVAVVDATLAPVITAEVDNAWAAMHGVVPSSSPSPSSFRLTVRPAFALPPQVLASSKPGTIELRLTPSSSSSSSTSDTARIDTATRLALRHEVVHQFLWRHCAPATRDRLFHEAVAVALSGEASVWREAGYLSVPDAARALTTADVDTPVARRAIARLVTESGAGQTALPRALQEGLARCVDDAPWVPLSIEALAGGDHVDVKDALIVLHAVTGEVLEASGAVDHAQPVGSTLKPFIVAASSSSGRDLPTLPSRPADPQWACGEQTPARVDVAAALQRSCNGWFLDLEARDGPRSVDLGAVGDVLLALGLNRLPTDMSEAIGIRTALTMSPRGLAEAFRALASSTPPPGSVDVMAALRVRGTLKDVPGVAGLAGMAAKTGTVRDLHSRPVLGLLVAVDDELVIVRARTGVQARALVDDVVAARTRHRGREHDVVAVQVFGLLPEHTVEVRCDGVGIVAAAAPRLSSSTSLTTLVGGGRALCARGAWRVTPGATIAERPYAGTFVRSPAPPPRPSSTSDPTVTPRQRAARRGADVVFSTSRARYTDAVLDAEDAGLRGEAKVALARVIDHNVDHGDARHPGRPVCDTTHCQTFKGTRSAKVDDVVVAALRRPLAATRRTGWLPFSQGGQAPWQEERAAAAVVTALGPHVSFSLRPTDAAGAVVVVVRASGADGTGDDVFAVPCELLRSRLRLPSCPTSAVREGTAWVFAGQGAGHGLGLDVEAAKAKAAAGASADTILDDAYPPTGTPGATRSTTNGR